MSIKGIIFDWAGTTVDYGCFAPVQVFIEIFKEKQIEVTLEEARKPMGLLKYDHVKAMLSMERIANEWKNIYGREWAETDVDEMYQSFEEKLFKILPNFATPVPRCLETIKYLRDNDIKIGSTTGYTKEMIDIVAKHAKEQGYAPDYCITSTEMPKGRPYPYMVFQNIITLALDNLYEVAKVGDTVSDIQEARNAGIWAVGIIKGSSELGLTLDEVNSLDKSELAKQMNIVKERLFDAGAHFVIDDIGELPSAINEINTLVAKGGRP